MGLLDGLLGNVLGSVLGGNQGSQQGENPLGAILSSLTGGSGGGGGNMLLQLAMTMLQQNGGLGGVLGKFQQAGLGAQADSWVGTGQNASISADQLQQVFGSSAIGDIAAKLGLSHEQAGAAMSQALPEVIDQLTPQGEVTEDSNNALAEGFEALTKSLGR
ncbi:MAG: DUF937 domain-containing protein [Deltaproteobacteria bacterium]|nr:DUF937 domain-containing protein [Deltaproteobacteria bacterium]